MDGFESSYIEHNIPLLLISGLEDDQHENLVAKHGIKVASELPLVNTREGQILVRSFHQYDGKHLPWRAITGSSRVRLKVIGRVWMINSIRPSRSRTEAEIGIRIAKSQSPGFAT